WLLWLVSLDAAREYLSADPLRTDRSARGFCLRARRDGPGARSVGVDRRQRGRGPSLVLSRSGLRTAAYDLAHQGRGPLAHAQPWRIPSRQATVRPLWLD